MLQSTRDSGQCLFIHPTILSIHLQSKDCENQKFSRISQHEIFHGFFAQKLQLGFSKEGLTFRLFAVFRPTSSARATESNDNKGFRKHLGERMETSMRPWKRVQSDRGPEKIDSPSSHQGFLRIFFLVSENSQKRTTAEQKLRRIEKYVVESSLKAHSTQKGLDFFCAVGPLGTHFQVTPLQQPPISISARNTTQEPVRG